MDWIRDKVTNRSEKTLSKFSSLFQDPAKPWFRGESNLMVVNQIRWDLIKMTVRNKYNLGKSC